MLCYKVMRVLNLDHSLKSLKLVAAINSNLKVIIISNVNPIYNTEFNTKFP